MRTAHRPLALLIAVLTVATLWASAVPVETPPPGSEVAEASFPGGNGRIAFACGVGESGSDVYVSDADGTHAQKIVSGGRPRWSADGTRIVYVYNDFDDGAKLKIGIVNADGTGLQDGVALGNDPAWSPDGESIVYTRISGDEPRGLLVRHVASGAERKIAGPEFPNSPSWSPDGKTIAYEEGGEIRVIPATGGVVKTLVPQGPAYNQRPDWSPDGSHIGFIGEEIQQVPAGGGQASEILGVDARELGYSPDGERLIYSSSSGPLAVAPFHGSGTPIPSPCANPVHPSWQPVASAAVSGKVTSVTCESDECVTKPLSGVKITASSANAKVSALTNGRGAYRIDGLAPATYTVVPSKGAGANALTFAPGSQAVVVGSKDVDGVDFATCGNPKTPTSRGAPDPCLKIDVKTKTPHDGSISAGERADYTVTVHAPSDKGKVILTGTLPDSRIATVVPGSITGGGKLVDGDITWTMNAATIKPVKFSLKVKTRGLPVDERTLGVAFGAALGRQTARRSADLDLMPCGQDPPEYPASRAISGAGWSMNAGVDREYGLAVTNLRVGTSPAVTRLISPRISVPYFVLQTTKLAKLTTLRLRPNGNDTLGRSRLLELDLKDADWKAKGFEFHAVYGIDHLGKGSGSCLLIKLTYEFRSYNADQTCNPLSKPGIVECSQFRPRLDYEFLGAAGEKLRYIETAQRLIVDIGGEAKTSALIRDHNLPPLPIAKELQISKETLDLAISQGRAGAWDNFHVSTDPDFVDAPGDLVRGRVFACLECFHSHWRWGKFLTLTLPYDSNPIIPKGSKQTVFVGVVKPRNYEEGDDIESLVQNKEPVRGGPVAYYWVASSSSASDSFFNHWNWVVPPGAFGATTSETAGRSALSRFVCPIHFNMDGAE